MYPAEFYYAMKSKQEIYKTQMQIQYEVARYQSVFVAAPNMKEQIRKPQDLGIFEWEKGLKPKVQTLEEQKQAVMAMALAFGAKFKTRK